ncbi:MULTISPECIES: transposase [unclassified Vibrio]|uniref:Transposase n=1 Tax=Vibrio sp. HB236076 TaxID=3232307 RepID=A0AB39HCJ6_9VIBR|nr:transposase [Vibrio sp. HB161653]MDP5254488.1 transposase [Vibrio sp. HB161653]
MTQPRSSIISLQDTCYYHCISRCVRRAYLCGKDDYSGKNFEHRRVWVIERLRLLSQVFAIDICAYAIMSNHYHLVLHVDQKQALTWSDQDVVKRWTSLYRAPPIIQRWLIQPSLPKEERFQVELIIERWRQQLMSISWFMRNINEYLARRANKEDDCKGRFWEGRFKSQALLDEQTLLSCMVYVDLNPVRSGEASSLEENEFTSIYERIHSVSCQGDRRLGQLDSLPKKPLFGFIGNQRQNQISTGIEYSFLDYLALVETLGQIVRPDKLGHLTTPASPILTRLDMDTDDWLLLSESFGRHFKTAVCGVAELRRLHYHKQRA